MLWRFGRDYPHCDLELAVEVRLGNFDPKVAVRVWREDCDLELAVGVRRRKEEGGGRRKEGGRRASRHKIEPDLTKDVDVKTGGFDAQIFRGHSHGEKMPGLR